MTMKTLCTLLLLLSVNFTMQAQYNNGPTHEELIEMREKAKKQVMKPQKNPSSIISLETSSSFF